MAKYLLKRSAQILVTLFVFLSLVFFIVNAQPGDVSNFYALNPDVPPETAMMNPGPPRVGPDPFWDWHHAFSLICRLDSRWHPKCPKQGEQ